MESGIKNALLLQSDEAVVVTAQEEFDDVMPDGECSGDLNLMMSCLMVSVHVVVIGSFGERLRSSLVPKLSLLPCNNSTYDL